jgi:hypothetical protein
MDSTAAEGSSASVEPLTIGRVARLDHDFFTGIRSYNRSDIRVPTVVAGLRLGDKWLSAIDFDAFHSLGIPSAIELAQPEGDKKSR